MNDIFTQSSLLHRGILIAILLFLLMPSAAEAGDPLLTITKDTLLGSVVGLVLGGTLTLVVDERNQSETIRWGIVIGTFGGFGFGLWHASNPGDELFGATDNDELGAVEANSQLFRDYMAAAEADRDQAGSLSMDTALGTDHPEWAVKLPVLQLSW